MSKATRAFVGVAMCVAAGLIVLPVLFGDPPKFTDRTGGDALRNLIYDFQTLITGVLAIIAASWTVMQMRETDRLQEIRHRQQLALSERRDRLAAERFTAFVPDLLDYYSMRIKRFLDRVPADQTEVIWSKDSVRRYLGACKAVRWTAELAEDERLRECKHLFTAEVHTALQNCVEWAKGLYDALPQDSNLLDWVEGEPDGYHPIMNLHLEDLHEVQRVAVNAIRAWAANSTLNRFD
ncbi:hypothetical protein AUSSIE_16 [Sinorhizobium phage Aussie]|nr:hypothetical protein AUSSIE_16 [Sinorhizobium phage Aussie]